MAEQDKAAQDLASAIEAGQDTHLGTSNRSAKPGQSVRVTLGGNMGAIDAIAGTPLSPGQATAVGFSESGEAIAAAPSGSETLDRETVIKERSHPRPKNGQPPASVLLEQNAVCPILISETIKKELEEPPKCACETWKIYKSASGAEIPYKGCAPGVDSPSYLDEEDANKNVSKKQAWGIYEQFFSASGGSGFPWVSGASCTYPAPSQYGYELNFFLDQGLNSHVEHSLFGITSGIEGQSNADILTINEILEHLNVIIFPQKGFSIGVARLFSPDNNPKPDIKRIGLLFGYRRKGTFLLDGRVVSTDIEPPEDLWWWRTNIKFLFAQDFDPGGEYENLSAFKDQFPYTETLSGNRLYYFCTLTRIFKNSNWESVQDSSLCPPPPELEGQPPGAPPGETDPDGKYRYFMTRYGIAGVTPNPLWLSFLCRADDPNFGQISMTQDRIYVSIHRGGQENQTKQKKEQHLKNATDRLLTYDTSSNFRPITAGNSKNSYIYSDDLVYSDSSSRRSYISSWWVAQSLNHSVSACEIWLYELKISADQTGNIVLSVIAADTYKPGDLIPENAANWKHSYMADFLVSYCFESAYSYRSMYKVFYQPLDGEVQWQKEVLEDQYADGFPPGDSWPGISQAFFYNACATYDLLALQGFRKGESIQASNFFSFFAKLSTFSSKPYDKAVKGLNFKTINLDGAYYEAFKKSTASAIDERFFNTMLMPLFNYIINDSNDKSKMRKYYKRRSPLWKGNRIRLSPFSSVVAGDTKSDLLIERYYQDRNNLAANIIKDKLYIIHFEQVDHIKKEDSEEVKAQKRLEYQHELKYRLIKSSAGDKAKAKIKVLDYSMLPPSIENLAAPPEGVSIEEIEAQIYPLGWTEGETMGLTIWGAAPGPALKPKK